MTAGEHFGDAVPAVPKGFVRCVQLRRINEPSTRKGLKSSDRDVYYFYCGDRVTVPVTAGWEPFGEQMTAAIANEWGSKKIFSVRRTTIAFKLSVEQLKMQNPVLVSAGVKLDDFSFTFKALSLDQTPSHSCGGEDLLSATDRVAVVGIAAILMCKGARN